jgi:hypothetical protein
MLGFRTAILVQNLYKFLFADQPGTNKTFVQPTIERGGFSRSASHCGRFPHCPCDTRDEHFVAFLRSCREPEWIW